MNLEFMRQIGRTYPDLLAQNLGRTNYQLLTITIEQLRAAGHAAFFVCKSPGEEGQYTPPGFRARSVIGLDGKPYQCSGVSHDALWCEGHQFDVLGSANHHDRPIYRKVTDPFWSFDPADGPQIRAVPTWDAVPQVKWRPNNPPLMDAGSPITPVAILTRPPRDYVRRFFQELDAFYKKRGRSNRSTDPNDPLYVDNEGLYVWLTEYVGHYMADHPTETIDVRHHRAAQATFADIEKEWR